tara:strand:- start:67 stop:1002 length:936 start_codon:yes stop_codon:yes gene_type:complete
MADFNDLGGVSILGFISPFNTGDTYPVIDPLYGIDGFRNVNTISELNSIPNARRRAGMFVGVSGGTEYYKLNSSPWSGSLSDWTLIYLTNSHITGFTYNGNNNTFTLSDGYDISLNAYLNSVSGLTSTGFITSNTLSATTYLNLPLDIFVTGGTYNNNIGRSVFTNNTGGTFNVDGFFTGNTDVFVTGGTYNSGVATFKNNTGGTFNVNGFFTGGTNSFLTTTITQSADTLSFDYNYYGVSYSGQVNLTLPNPSGFDGRSINIKDESGNAGIYRIRLTPSFGLIDGATYVDMNLNYISLNIVARNNNWWII